MNARQADLTPAERAYLEHARQAQSQGVSVAEYYRLKGLSVYTLYNVRRQLVRKGLLPRVARRERAASKPAQFVAVRVAQPAVAAAGMPCRLRHPSGWVIECAGWPQTSWVRELVGERP